MTDQPTNPSGNGSGSRRPEPPLFTISPELDDSPAAKAQRRIRHEMKKLRNRVLAPIKWMAYETGQTRFVPPPDRMYIESTNLCNLDCIMCPTGLKQITRPKGYMDFELFKAIVDEMAPYVKATTLHIWGEPLMHKRIFDMIAYCRQKGLRAEISTNATLLDERKARGLLEAGLSTIYLCLDGFRPETYESIRVKADYDRTNANIRRFLELKTQGGYTHPYVNLQIIQMEQTLPEIEEFVKAWSLPGVDHINVKPFDSWGGQIEQIAALRADDPAAFLPPQRYACPNLWYHVHIYWDGRLAMCDRDFNLAYDLGSVISPDGKVEVMKNWNGPKMQELRRLHVEGLAHTVKPCDTCVEWAWWKPRLFGGYGNYNAALLEKKDSRDSGMGSSQ
ncbi:MAG: radical SAM protein [Caldilineales bacterium]|nr:radical SAM protein [Caldilineales bacterium]MDW8317667.1 radical SAM/SPASM domain-containing protein [Anaerolineae bacterium]